MKNYRYKVKGINPIWIKTKEEPGAFLCMDIWIDSFLKLIKSDPYNCGVIPCELVKKDGANFFDKNVWKLRQKPKSAFYWQNNKSLANIPMKKSSDQKYERALVTGMVGKTFKHPMKGGSTIVTFFINQLISFFESNPGVKGRLPITASYYEDGKVLFFVNQRRLRYLIETELT